MGEICMKSGIFKKTCSFYVSNYHLVTMLLPYIKEKTREGASIKTFLEENIEENMMKLVENFNIQGSEKEKILGIDWNLCNTGKYSEIEEKLQQEKVTNIIISGKYEYVEKMNKIIEKWLERNDINTAITINNCYNVTKFHGDINNILMQHDNLLNTSGVQEISVAFKEA